MHYVLFMDDPTSTRLLSGHLTNVHSMAVNICTQLYHNVCHTDCNLLASNINYHTCEIYVDIYVPA